LSVLLSVSFSCQPKKSNIHTDFWHSCDSCRSTKDPVHGVSPHIRNPHAPRRSRWLGRVSGSCWVLS